MTAVDWLAQPVNWAFLGLGAVALAGGLRVVTSKNVIHAALALVAALAASAGLFLLLSAEFVAWVLVLVYIGAVIVLFLFGIMITRAPTGRDVALDHPRKTGAALVAGVLFVVLAWGSLRAFGATPISQPGAPTSTAILGTSLLGRFVVPFEAVSFVLLAALIGGITVARRDLTPVEEEEGRGV
jgi:NADH-quinone oxidoreductase subunit J